MAFNFNSPYSSLWNQRFYGSGGSFGGGLGFNSLGGGGFGYNNFGNNFGGFNNGFGYGGFNGLYGNNSFGAGTGGNAYYSLGYAIGSILSGVLQGIGQALFGRHDNAEEGGHHCNNCSDKASFSGYEWDGAGADTASFDHHEAPHSFHG